ncbi:hypothetical protein [Streptomyces phaeochromogenes]|uniref:hypothetical protein n=1 Tax=Streptomyces phaeochromogenes TaxID=1923 RepID=UPI0033ECF307
MADRMVFAGVAVAALNGPRQTVLAGPREALAAVEQHLRDLGHRPDTGAGDFFEFGALHSRTVYLDALLLGSLQRDHIDELTDELTDELSEVFNSSRLARRVATLERNIAVFRSTYWRQHLTAHGAANDLLLALQNQHRLPARFNEILAEAADYSRLVQTQESQQISGSLGVLTILGLPLGTASASCRSSTTTPCHTCSSHSACRSPPQRQSSLPGTGAWSCHRCGAKTEGRRRRGQHGSAVYG